MASQGPLSANSAVNDTAVGTVAFANTGNCLSSDGSYANADGGSGSYITNYLKATDFGFAVPSGATINGIVVEIERFRSGASCIDSEVKLVRADGTIGSTNKATATAWASADPDSYITYGSSSDLWGETLTHADVNDADFGVVLSVNKNAVGSPSSARVDHIRITVYYTESSGGSRLTASGRLSATGRLTATGRLSASGRLTA